MGRGFSRGWHVQFQLFVSISHLSVYYFKTL